MGNEQKTSKIKKYLKWNLYLLIIIFVLSIILQVVDPSKKPNPIVEAVNQQCYNPNAALNRSFIEGNKYEILKKDFIDGKYNCTVIDARIINSPSIDPTFIKLNLTDQDGN